MPRPDMSSCALGDASPVGALDARSILHVARPSESARSRREALFVLDLLIAPSDAELLRASDGLETTRRAARSFASLLASAASAESLRSS